MRTIDTHVVAGKSGWDINDDEEVCSVEENFLASLPLEVGNNIRIYNNERGTYSTMTIARDHTEDGGEEWIRMGLAARENFYDDENGETVADSFDADIYVRPPPSGVQTADEAESNSTLFDDWYISPLSNRISLAQHGGVVEHGTDEMAYNFSDFMECSYWITHGYGGIDGAFDNWHITSVDIHEDSWGGLRRVFYQQPFDTAVSFQGFSEPDIIVGGRVDLALREEIAERIRALNTGYDVLVVGKNTDSQGYESFDGDSIDNIVNRLTKNDDNGIQIEMPSDVRSNYQEEIPSATAKAMITYYGGR